MIGKIIAIAIIALLGLGAFQYFSHPNQTWTDKGVVIKTENPFFNFYSEIIKVKTDTHGIVYCGSRANFWSVGDNVTIQNHTYDTSYTIDGYDCQVIPN
jgi:hypothetical protein